MITALINLLFGADFVCLVVFLFVSQQRRLSVKVDYVGKEGIIV